MGRNLLALGVLRPMEYDDGSLISLGDIVAISMPSGDKKARVVMLGDTYAHLDIDKEFVKWVEQERFLGASQIVVEWLDRNPFAHTDPQYSPVDNFMFTEADEDVIRVA